MIGKNRVWVVDDDRAIRWVLEKALQQAEMSVVTFKNGVDALAQLGSGVPDAIVADIRMPGLDGLSLLNRVREKVPDLPVIIMTAHSDLDSAVSAYQEGAFDYLPKPFDVDEAVALIQRACELRRQKSQQAEQLESVPEIIGAAPAMQEVFRAIGRLSRSNITVLINGESGTGKELVARALHRHSPRSSCPFIAINTAAIPRDLLESELFGHERGAFTGAHTVRQGRFEQADGGTLFLDEIGDMPSELQTRLLRVLAEGEFYRVGGHTAMRVDVRVIAATHQDLEQRVSQGLFREDLFHRLNVIRINLPALRQRREDIPVLMAHFLRVTAAELEVEAKVLTAEAENYLGLLEWPGNVRQLENLCRWLTVMASGRHIHLNDLPLELRQRAPSGPSLQGSAQLADNPDWQEQLARWARQRLVHGDHRLLDRALPAFERVLINVALEQSGGHRQDAARLLGWGRNTLTRKIKELQID